MRISGGTRGGTRVQQSTSRTEVPSPGLLQNLSERYVKTRRTVARAFLQCAIIVVVETAAPIN